MKRSCPICLPSYLRYTQTLEIQSTTVSIWEKTFLSIVVVVEVTIFSSNLRFFPKASGYRLLEFLGDSSKGELGPGSALFPLV